MRQEVHGNPWEKLELLNSEEYEIHQHWRGPRRRAQALGVSTSGRTAMRRPGSQTHPCTASTPQMIFKSLLRHRLLRAVVRNVRGRFGDRMEVPGPGGSSSTPDRLSVTPASSSRHVLKQRGRPFA